MSSGVFGSPDDTTHQLAEVARRLRDEHRFGGYIHLKAVAGASPLALAKAGAYADRVVLLQEGCVVADGPTELLLSDEALLEAHGLERP